MILQETVIINLTNHNIPYYESLGYPIPRYLDARNVLRVKKGTELQINIKDLSNNSNIKISYKCDNCNFILSGSYSEIKKDSQLCISCAHKTEKFRNKLKQIKTGTKASEKTRKKFSEERQGSNNPNYNPKITDEERQNKRQGIGIWKRKVKERDEHTCQCCGYKGELKDGIMVAHHLDNYNNFKELRLDVNNGITLCKDCHCSKKELGIHNIFGLYTTLSDFNIFKNIFGNHMYIHNNHPEKLTSNHIQDNFQKKQLLL